MLRLTGHNGTVHALTFGEGGQLLVSAGKDGTVRLWNVATGREEARLDGHSTPVLSVAVHQNQRALATGGSDGTLKLWDLVSGQPVHSYPKQMAAVTGLSWMPQRNSLLVACGERLRPERPGEIRRLDDGSSKSARSISLEAQGVWSLAIARLSSIIAWCGGARKVDVHDVTLQRPRSFRQSAASLVVALSDDGAMLASGQDRSIRVWDVRSGRERSTLQAHRGLVRALAISPCGRQLASAGHDGTVRIWGVGESNVRPGPVYEWPIGPVHSLAYSPNGLTAAAAGENGDIWLWDLED
jgi:WD40 repeat protein